MATYKVPQDVEAEDKLIGPFSFRQFVYLIVVVLAIALAWGLAQLFIPLAVIPLPIIIFFGALALPLRKDQPMEIYLAAMVSFYLKPRKRFWDADGIESLIEITAPKIVEVERTKNISQNDAEQRFSYLAEIVDSEGWAVRGQGVQAPNTAMETDTYFAAQQATDLFDADNSISHSFDYMIGQSDEKRHEDMMAKMQANLAAPAANPVSIPVPNPYAAFGGPTLATQPADLTQLQGATPQTPTYNPYPTAISQTMIQPTDDPTHQFVQPTVTQPSSNLPPTTSETTVSPDIMNLANNADLSIETIAHEANRLQQKNDDMQEEVVISLR
jgi:hypothetical protein